MPSSAMRPAGFGWFAFQSIVCHTVTYIVFGILASSLLDYASVLADPYSGMRPITDKLVMAGPLFQPIRGLLFASVLYPLRNCLFGRRYGWLLMAWVLIAVGILSTFAAASGSVEGLVYLRAPVATQLRGWLEIVPQAISLSALLYYWVNHPAKWLNWVMGVAFFVAMALPVLGLLTTR